VLLIPKIHIASAVALLGAYGVWMLFGAVETHSWYMGVLGAVLLFAAGGAVTRQRWARFLVYAFATVFTFQWLRIVGGEITSGFLIPYLKDMPLLQAVLVFIPAGVMFVLTGYCCYVASRYFGNRDDQV
jgi:hypothetical protein